MSRLVESNLCEQRSSNFDLDDTYSEDVEIKRFYNDRDEEQSKDDDFKENRRSQVSESSYNDYLIGNDYTSDCQQKIEGPSSLSSKTSSLDFEHEQTSKI